MSEGAAKDPLHGMTLKAILEDLVERHGWEGLAEWAPGRCFTHYPSIGSSLHFLRRTPWARTKVESLYVRDQRWLKLKVEREKLKAEREKKEPK